MTTAILVVAGFLIYTLLCLFFGCLCAAAGDADERKGWK